MTERSEPEAPRFRGARSAGTYSDSRPWLSQKSLSKIASEPLLLTLASVARHVSIFPGNATFTSSRVRLLSWRTVGVADQVAALAATVQHERREVCFGERRRSDEIRRIASERLFRR